MSIGIKNKLEHLKAEASVSNFPDLNYSRAINTYHAEILTRLDKIFLENDDSHLVAALENFLAENWTHVQGTAFCYTALHDSSVTDLLCDVATYVVEEKNKLKHGSEDRIGIIQILMPTVYPYFLTPTEPYPNLIPTAPDWKDVDIRTILKTHILGREGKYLIPVACLLSYDENIGVRAIVNPYFDVMDHKPEMAYLDAGEIQRLIDHSTLTREVYDAKMALEVSSDATDTMLKRLRSLSTQLKFNSVNGVGEERSAGAGIYPAIVDFLSYYDDLVQNSPEQIERIPPPIKEEIATLRDFASNKERIGDIFSCLAIRRGALEGAIKGQEDLLSNIGFSEGSKNSIIADAKAKLMMAREGLLVQISDRSYVQGFDKLSFPWRVIAEFNLDISFSSFKDLELLRLLTAAEIIEFCSLERYKRAILGEMVEGSIENLANLSQKLSPQQLHALLSGLEPDLFSRQSYSASKFASLLMTLSPDRQKIYFQMYNHKLCSLIKDATDFGLLFSIMPDEDQQTVYEEFKPRVGDFFLEDLPDYLKSLNAERRKDLLNTFKEHQLLRVGKTDVLSRERMILLYQKLADEISTLPEDNFVMDCYVTYITAYAKVTALPATKKYLCSSFENTSAFFQAAAIPFIGFGFPLAAAIAGVLFGLNALWALLSADWTLFSGDVVIGVVCVLAAIVLTVLASALALLTGPGFFIRCLTTVGSWLVGEWGENNDEAVESDEYILHLDEPDASLGKSFMPA